MESAISSLPQVQGQQQGIIGSNQAAAAASATASSSSLSSSPSSTSGAIGPFFAVMSVLMVLAILSCVLGRICSRRRVAVPVTPLDTIKHGSGWLGWLRRKCGRFMAGEVEVGAKVMSVGEDKHNDAPQV